MKHNVDTTDGTSPDHSSTGRFPFFQQADSAERARQTDSVQPSSSEQEDLFVGRVRELAVLDTSLAEHRLVTLTGAGGVGKSRLARQRIARGLSADVGQACWADLWQLQDAALLVPLVADACDLADHTARMPIEALCSWISKRRMLLVLDSCEHLVDSCRHLVAELLTTCPNLTVLVTSREPLHLNGERVIRVDPLPHTTDAVRLFVIRAAEAGTHVGSPAELRLAAKVCTHLDGVPLALELAAAQLHSQSIEELAQRTGLSLEMPHVPEALVGPAPRRHGALRTAVGWSHELCTPQERLVWARLSVLRGRFDEEAATAICAYPPLTAHDVGRGLAALVDKSVVITEQFRYRMLDTIREYGRLWLDELDEVEQAADRHAAHHLGLVRQADSEWAGPHQASWYRAVTMLHADLCAAVEHLLDRRPDDALELAGLVGFLWTCGGRLHEAQQYLQQTLARSSVRGPVRMRGQWALGLTHILQGDYEAGRNLASACSNEAHRDGTDPVGILRATYLHALSDLLQGNPRKAMDRVDQVLAAVEPGKDAKVAGPVLMCRLARVFALTGFGWLSQARHEAELLRDECAANGEHWTRSYAEYQLCVISLLQDNAHGAVQYARAMLASKQQIGDSFGIALGLDMLGASLAAGHDGTGSALAYGAGDRYWQAVGHPQRGTPDVAPLREQGARDARRLLGISTYERWYRHAAGAKPEAMLAWAVTGKPSGSPIESEDPD